MQVLIAEDDPLTRRLIAALLTKAGGMDLTEAGDGEEALALLGRIEFDLLLLDWDMPGKPGIEIVRRLRSSGSRIPIVMVTATSQRERVVEALSAGVSDYIIKPFEPRCLLGKVEKFRQRSRRARAAALPAGELLPQSVASKEAVAGPRRARAGRRGEGETAESADGGKPLLTTVLGQIDDVSTIPEIATRLLKAASDPDVTIDDLGTIMANDPATSTRVLRLVNSSAYSVQQKITSLEQAIAYLGIKQVRSLAVAVSVNQLFRARGSLGGYSREGLWRHMFSVGTCSRLLAKRLGLPECEEFFLAGLLHDIGIVLEDQYVHQPFCQIIKSLVPEKTLIQCEHEHLGFDHTELGQCLGERWKLPDAVRAAIRHHHDSRQYDQEDKMVVRCVELANVICSAQGATSVGINLVQSVTPEDLGISLGEEDLALLAQDLNQELAASASLFKT
jgi:HD-like signal output (HDOD) protein/DNA-binding NarL/FixJ family response regulator